MRGNARFEGEVGQQINYLAEVTEPSALGIVRLDQGIEPLSRHDLLHLAQELLAPALALLARVLQARKARLLHGFNHARRGPELFSDSLADVALVFADDRISCWSILTLDRRDFDRYRTPQGKKFKRLWIKDD